MNKDLFLKQLQLQLRGLPSEEIAEILADYEDYFENAQVNGLLEEEIIDQLGNPYDIAKDLKTSYQSQRSHHVSNESQFSKGIIIIGLIFFNLTIVLGPTLGIIGSFFGLVFASGVFVVTPLLAFVSILFGIGHLFEFFLSFILSGIGMLILPLLLKLARPGLNLIHRYIQWNIRLMKGDAI